MHEYFLYLRRVMKGKKVILVVAHEGYQPVEYGIPYQLLKNAGITVLTASNKPGMATAKDLSSTPVDITLEQINPVLYDGIFLIGGPGALKALDNSVMHALLQQMKALQKHYGAICISPRILAHANVLGGKKATGWNEDHKLEEIFKKYAVIYAPEPVVIDHEVITAVGPQAAQAFGQAILNALS